jgi:hypothetical protein
VRRNCCSCAAVGTLLLSLLLVAGVLLMDTLLLDGASCTIDTSGAAAAAATAAGPCRGSCVATSSHCTPGASHAGPFLQAAGGSSSSSTARVVRMHETCTQAAHVGVGEWRSVLRQQVERIRAPHDCLQKQLW